MSATWKCAKPYPDQGIWYIDEADAPEPLCGFIATVSNVDGKAEERARQMTAAPELLFIVRELVTLFFDCGTLPDPEGAIRFQSLMEHASAVLRDIPTPDPRSAAQPATSESARAKLPAVARTHPPERPPCSGGTWGRTER